MSTGFCPMKISRPEHSPFGHQMARQDVELFRCGMVVRRHRGSGLERNQHDLVVGAWTARKEFSAKTGNRSVLPALWIGQLVCKTAWRSRLALFSAPLRSVHNLGEDSGAQIRAGFH